MNKTVIIYSKAHEGVRTTHSFIEFITIDNDNIQLVHNDLILPNTTDKFYSLDTISKIEILIRD